MALFGIGGGLECRNRKTISALTIEIQPGHGHSLRMILRALVLLALFLTAFSCRQVSGPVRVRPVAKAVFGVTDELTAYNAWVARAARAEGWQLADELAQTGLKRHHRRKGAGVPVLTGKLGKEGGFPGGSLSAMTAVLDGGKLKLLDAGLVDTVMVGGKKQPLAADFTVPWAVALDNAGFMAVDRYRDALKPGSPEQIYLMEPYDPGRAVLLLVHGWKDGPLMWRQLVNDLRADAGFRRKYQVWTFRYSTALPPLVAAAGLRRELRNTAASLDPVGQDKACRDVVVVAHSMGGLLAHTLVSDSGNAVWDAAVGVAREVFRATPADRAVLEDWFCWKASPEVRRVVFVCVPHHGSKLARSLGKVGRSLAHPRKDVAALVERVSGANPEALGKKGQWIAHTSVDDLAGNTPAMDALAALPVKCPFHSVAGAFFHEDSSWKTDRGGEVKSALLSGARSEHIIRSGHKAYNAQTGFRAIAGILKEHR